MRLACTSACLLLLTAVAHAQQPTDDGPDAIGLFEQSRKAFEAGDYLEAARLSRRAYELSPNGDLLYNHARALDLGKDTAGALAGYRDFVKRYPGHGKQRFAEQRIEELATLQQQVTQPPAPAPDPAPRPSSTPDTPSSLSPWPWVLAGVGVAAVVAGFVVGGVSAARHDDAVDEPQGVRALELQTEAEDLELAAIITLAAGGAVAAAGVIWGIVDLTAPASDVGLDARGLRIRF